MKKAHTTNKAFLLFTLIFVALAAFSFAAFEQPEPASTLKSCSKLSSPTRNGEMIWDVLSRRLISFVLYK